MKNTTLLLIFLMCACNTPEPVPSNLSGTRWHWFEFNRGSEPANHWLKFSDRTAEYRNERGNIVNVENVRYQVESGNVILDNGTRTDTLTIQKDKLVVKKSAELFEFYVRVR